MKRIRQEVELSAVDLLFDSDDREMRNKVVEAIPLDEDLAHHDDPSLLPGTNGFESATEVQCTLVRPAEFDFREVEMLAALCDEIDFALAGSKTTGDEAMSTCFQKGRSSVFPSLPEGHTIVGGFHVLSRGGGGFDSRSREA